MATAELPLRQSKRSENPGKKMPPALFNQYRRILRILNKSTVADAARRFEMAVLIKQVRDGEGGRYGLQAMKRLAKLLGYSEESLRIYTMVPAAWTKAEFRKLLLRKTKRGRIISWSHFGQIAQIMSPARRKALIERVISENLSVRDLKQIPGGGPAAETATERPTDDAAAVPSTVRAGVRRMTAAAHATVGGVKLWKTAVFDRLRATKPSDVNEKLRNELREAHAAQVQAEEACHTTAQELAEVFQAITGKSVTSPQKSTVNKSGGKG